MPVAGQVLVDEPFVYLLAMEELAKELLVVDEPVVEKQVPVVEEPDVED